MNMNSYPLYIPSKGRWKTRLTSDFLSKNMRTYHHIVVEEEQLKDYRAATKGNPFVKLIVLDKAYQKDYDAFDNLGMEKSKGSGPARNFIWDHASGAGHAFHWIMDDNIRAFYRLNRNIKARVTNSKMFRAMEAFAERYDNLGMTGPHYEMFVPRKFKRRPFVFNTRIFSCNLIRNDVPFRWRGRYNEDTDLSLRMLKNGWCTVLFYAFLQEKETTQSMKGGNTDEIYKDGTLAKSKMIVDMHPDVCKLVKRYNRWHHQCNYRKFGKLKLKFKEDVSIDKGIDDFGMKLRNYRN